MIATSGPAPAKTNSYDAAGNLLSDGTTKYTYGIGGRLERASATGAPTSYRYNGLGQRVVKSRNADVIAYYVYDNEGQLLGEYDGRGNPIQETIYLEKMPVAVIAPALRRPTSTDVYYVYPDHLGAPRILTRASDNKMIWRWEKADPFGLYQPDENPSGLGKFTYNLRFPGQVFDRETNNFYNYFRDYDPLTGRYFESDPIGLSGGTNTYAYVGGNPVAYHDFFGLAPGDLYRTADKAAVAAIRDIFHLTAASGNEWGGRVYRLPTGMYSYTTPAEGNRMNMGQVPPLTCPNGGTNQGMYHTHPNVPTYSNGTGNPNIVSGGDQYWADKEQVPIFVGTPNGKVLKYTPNGTPYDGPVTIIGRVK